MSNSPMVEDEALISRIIEGDMESFRRLIKQHERLVAHMVGRIVKNTEDREELCQDVFLKVYDKLKGFNFQSKLSTWIATIAYRHAINHIRKKKIPIDEPGEWEEFKEQFIADDNLEEELADKDLEEHVMEYINQLPVHYRSVLTMYHVDGMSYQEIGKITDMPEGTVKNYLFRARNLLKEKVKKYLGTEELR
ncbi:MAG TPA: sigma-70 family RNA polymerase sigma factor [Cyclobacteriaceae bacterium]|nr:sigma-70 family RNA polymerase sigma factor [Cyclobacteriaceae bacterium]